MYTAVSLLPQVRLRAASVKEEDEVMDQQEVPRETSVKDK